MFGLVLAVLFLAYAVVTHMPVEAALVSLLGFLWWWHIAATVVVSAILLPVVLGGTTVSLAAKRPGLGALVLLGGRPLVVILMAISQTLFLGGVYLVQLASVGPTGTLPLAQWNMTFVVIGCIMYVLGCLRQISAKFNISQNS